MVWAGWVGYGVAVVAACGGLTRALMRSLLNVTSWSTWQPWAPFGVDDITDGTVATVLGLMGLLLWLAAIGHLLVMITRSRRADRAGRDHPGRRGRAGLRRRPDLVLEEPALVPRRRVHPGADGADAGRRGADHHRRRQRLAEGTQQAIGTALPGVILILIACVAPLALFKLLAFVDPATSSGAALRTGMAEVGGVRGLLAGTSSTGGRRRRGGLMAAPRVRRRRRTRPTPGCSTPRPGCSARSAAPPAVPQPPRWEPSTPSGPAPPPSGPT